MGVDPLLQRVPFGKRSRLLTGFVQQVWEGYYGRGTTIHTGTVCTAITAIGQMIAMAHGETPTKTIGSEKFFTQLQQCINGYRKQNPVSQKKLPVEADVPEYLVECTLDPSARELNKAVEDLSLIAFYHLLQVGEYIVKGKQDNSKQTVQFKMEDVLTTMPLVRCTKCRYCHGNRRGTEIRQKKTVGMGVHISQY
jgi:hypothetical protein